MPYAAPLHPLYTGNDLYLCDIFYLSNIYFQIFLDKYNKILAFSYSSCCPFVDQFIFLVLKLIFFVGCSLKNSQNFFMQFLPLYTSCLFYMLLNDDIVNIEKPDGICLLTFAVDEFLGLCLHPSIFLLYTQDLHK